MSEQTKHQVELGSVTLPICSHGFRSGWAYGTVDGKAKRLYTSKPDTSSYNEHVAEVKEQFRRGEGEPL